MLTYVVFYLIKESYQNWNLYDNSILHWLIIERILELREYAMIWLNGEIQEVCTRSPYFSSDAVNVLFEFIEAIAVQRIKTVGNYSIITYNFHRGQKRGKDIFNIFRRTTRKVFRERARKFRVEVKGQEANTSMHAVIQIGLCCRH